MDIPGTYCIKLNKPIVMCQSTLDNLYKQTGVQDIKSTNVLSSSQNLNKPTQFFELLAKTYINNKLLNDAYSVVCFILINFLFVAN